MAETIDYKVHIDTSGLADQLQNIKNQVDQAMAAYTFKTAPASVQPQSYAFPDNQFIGNVAAGAPTGVSFGQSVDQGAQMALGSVNNLIETGRLGFQKITQDMQNLALSTSIGRPPQLMNFSEANRPSFEQMGFARSALEAATGFGYDPRMSLTRGDYERYARNNFTDRIVPGLVGAAEISGTVLGAAGLVAPMFGYAAAGATMGAIATPLAIAPLLAQDAVATSNMRSFIRDSSFRFLSGRFSDQQAGDLALYASQLGRTEATMGQRMSLTDVQETLRAYTQAGGFDFVRSADEFKTAMQSIISTVSQGAQTLRMSREDYAAFHAQLTRMGVVSGTQDALAIQKSIAAQAIGAGYNPQELIQFGQQTAEMVRGTGINMGSALLGGMTTLTTVGEMMQAGVISNQLAMQLGGRENIAATMNRLGYEWGTGRAGFTYLAAAAAAGPGYNAGADSPMGMLTKALGYFNGDVGRYMDFQGNIPETLSNYTGQDLFALQSAQFIKEAGTMLGYSGYGLNQQRFRFMMQQKGMGVAEADLRWNMMNYRSNNVEYLNNVALEGANAMPSIVDVAIDRFETGLARSLGLPIIAGAANDLSNWVSNKTFDLSNWFTKATYGFERARTNKLDVDYNKMAKILFNEPNKINLPNAMTPGIFNREVEYRNKEEINKIKLGDELNKLTPGEITTYGETIERFNRLGIDLTPLLPREIDLSPMLPKGTTLKEFTQYGDVAKFIEANKAKLPSGFDVNKATALAIDIINKPQGDELRNIAINARAQNIKNYEEQTLDARNYLSNLAKEYNVSQTDIIEFNAAIIANDPVKQAQLKSKWDKAGVTKALSSPGYYQPVSQFSPGLNVPAVTEVDVSNKMTQAFSDPRIRTAAQQSFFDVASMALTGVGADMILDEGAKILKLSGEEITKLKAAKDVTGKAALLEEFRRTRTGKKQEDYLAGIGRIAAGIGPEIITAENAGKLVEYFGTDVVQGALKSSRLVNDTMEKLRETYGSSFNKSGISDQGMAQGTLDATMQTAAALKVLMTAATGAGEGLKVRPAGNLTSLSGMW